MKLGYCRVSTDDQHLDAQRAALTAAGVERIYEEKESPAAGGTGPSSMNSFARSAPATRSWSFDSTGYPARFGTR